MTANTDANAPSHPYGADDVIGAANEVTEEVVRRAARLVTSGRRYALGQILDADSPTQMWRYWRHHLLTDHAPPERAVGTNEMTFLEESVSGALHSGTHLDGLAHVGIGGQLYNGHQWADIVSATGVTMLGIEHVPPLFARGVLLDVAAIRRQGILSDGEPITADDLQSAADVQHLTVSAGDIVIVHTGWGALWGVDDARYASCEPGITETAAQWCIDRRVAVIGADNWAVEQVTVDPAEAVFPVHQQAITRAGIYLLENVRTSELVRDDVREFCCVISPIRLRGASASMVSPVAVI